MVKSIQKKPSFIPKKVVNIKNRKTSVLSSKTTKVFTNLFGIECQNGVYIAWLEKSGPVKEAAYILPFTTAFENTVSDDNAQELYPDSQHHPGTILDLWKIDYIMNRRETTREHSNSILFSKGYPFKCFVWIRPDEGPFAGMTLDRWLHNLYEQMMAFVPFTAKHDSLYGKFKCGLNLRTIVEKTVHYAAQELLDGDVLHIIHDSYDGFDINELIRHDAIRSMYFGPERTADPLLDLVAQHQNDIE